MASESQVEQNQSQELRALRTRIAELEETQREQARQSELRFRQLAETIHDVFWIASPGLREMHYVSPAYEEIWGRPMADLLAHPLSFIDAIVPEDAEQVRSEIEQCPHGPWDFEYRIRRPDNTIRWIHDRGYPITDEQGHVERVVGIASDTTRFREAEAALRTSETRFKLAAQCATDLVYEWDIASHRLEWFGDIDTALGYAPGEFPRTMDAWLAAIHPDDGERLHEIAERQRIEGGTIDLEYRIRRADGTWLIWADRGTTVCDEETGQPIRMVGACSDITQLKRAQDALRESEALLRETNRVAKIGGWELDCTKNRLTWTDEVRRIHEVPDDFVPSVEAGISFYAPEAQSIIRQAVERSLETGTPFDLELPFITAKGNRRWVHTIGRAARRGERTVRMFGTFQDITERHNAEHALRESEARHRAVVEASPTAIFVIRAGRYAYANPAGTQMLGYERPGDIVGADAMAHINPDQVATLRKRMKSAESGCPNPPMELCVTRVDGTECISESTSVPIELGGERAIVVIGQDITDRKQAEAEREALEEQLRQSQKMEAVGQLAGGVAHDFNNILTAILGNAELLRGALAGHLPSDDALMDSVDQIEQSGQRAADLTRQLLAFSRKQVVKPETLDPCQLVQNMEKMLRRLIREDIDFSIECDGNVPPIRIDRGQAEQVVLNLIVNARDAVGEAGQIRVRIMNATVDDAHIAKYPDAHHGAHVRISVSDTGVGMNNEVRQRVFEPFFTTKPSGTGTGLGLATVHGIVRQAQGHITVDSAPHRGSTFSVYFPAATAAREQTATPGAPAGELHGHETILVCEDDARVRSLAVRALEARGYTVIEAADAQDAIGQVKHHDGNIDLLLTDVVMPGMNGRELAEMLVRQMPSLHVLYTSGYAADAIGVRGMVDDGVNFLEKPYTTRALLLRIRMLLNR